MKVSYEYMQDQLVKRLQKEKRYYEICQLFCNTNYLDGWKFLFFRENRGVSIPNSIFFQQGNLLTLGINGHSNISYLDKNQALSLSTKEESQVGFAQCINFDTNVVSYMDSLFLTKDKASKMDVYLFLRSILEQRKGDFTCNPYTFENCTKLDDRNVLEGVRRSLGAFCMYRSFNNVEEFDDYFESPSTLFFSEKIVKEVNDFVDMMFKMKNFIDKGDILLLQKPIHALLLQAVIIRFSSNKGIKFKASQLFDFFVNKLGIFMERELAICYLYLNNDKRIERFFGRIQANNKDILAVLEGMSWDLQHIRNLEKYMTTSDYENANFEIHALATFDNGLKDMLSVYPIEGFSFKEGRDSRTVTFQYEFSEFIKEIDVESYKNKRRQERRHVIFKKTDFDYLIREQQAELLALFKQ
ncbi:hypothetical protein [Listeria booriae]|uniref:Uncharacterized protein n=1 Tax=Listeria booriae TaxID=1552123 RepID=A0A7X0YP51_9LIST|nr:hypothetical protein [Listeria booriae]MBC2117986.1 hypothetical protein [Listeria booriae]MBC2390584.1 hypothetical protein [Listeria booriae]